MTGNAPKVHLLRRRIRDGINTACGVAATRVSRNPDEVSCGACKRTVAMADAEAKQVVKRQRRARFK